jgi:type II secretory pathway pseudopilin PulG
MTLVELIVVIGMMGILTTTVMVVYNFHFKSWNESYTRSRIRGNLAQALELASNQLRQAQTIDAVTQSSITFTANSGGGTSSYRLYLYNADDSEPNPPYTQSTYSLRFAQDSVNYGDGAILSSDIAQPTSPAFSISSKVISINLTALSGEQEIAMRTKVRPRNL